MKLGDAIRLIRTARRRTQSSLAGEIGVSNNFVSLIEANRKVPSIEVLQQIAAALRVPSGMFLLWTESVNSNLPEKKLRRLRDLMLDLQTIYLESEDNEKGDGEAA
jgi:transcriptional regulator with XRE-family HTH domain